MEKKPVFVVSDVHLGAVPAETERQFRAFLQRVQISASGLLINGDLFDFWFEYRTVIPGQHVRVLAALADVVEAGVPVWFVGGNHDAWGNSFLSREIGLRLLEGPLDMDLAGRRALVAHGDGVGAGDLKYRALRSVIRHPFTTRAFRSLHPDLGSRIAGRASTTHAKAEGEDPREKGRARHIEQWAVEQLRARREIDLVLAGHAHTPTLVEVEPGRFYVNSGDWIRHFTYVVLAESTPPQMRRWPD